METRESIRKIIAEQGFDLIPSILGNLDCEKMHRTMKCLDWKWHAPNFVGDGEPRVPTPVEIYKEAVKLIAGALERMYQNGVGSTQVECGGFLLVIEIEDGCLHGSILFYITRSDSLECD